MRTRTKVNYADFDPEQGPPPHTFSDEEEFNPGSEPEVDEEMEDAVPESEDEIVKQEDDQVPPSPPVEQVSPAPKSKPGSTPKKPGSSRMDKLPRVIKPSAPAPKIDTAPPIPLQINKDDRPSSAKYSSYGPEKLGDRFRFFFGADNDELLKAVETRIEWGPVGLIPEQSIVNKKKLFNSEFSPESRETSPLTCVLEEVSPQVEFKGHPLTVNEHTLWPGSKRATDNVILLNAGSFVKQAKLAPFSETLFLAVSIIPNDLHPLDVNASDPSLSIYSSANTESIIQFYDQDMQPFAEISCGLHGPVVKLEWRPVVGSHELAVLFQDGLLALIPKPTTKGTYVAQIDEAVRLDSRITSICWSTEDELICGTIDGYVAAFNVYDAKVLLFYHPLHLSVITDISASFGSNLRTFITTSPDGDSRVTDFGDFSKSIPVARSRGFIPSVKYIRHLNSYVTQEDHITSRLVLAHTPSMSSGTQLTMHSGSVTTFATSLMHPFVLSGSTDGSVAIVNGARRAMTPKRSLKGEVSAFIWRIQCNERTKAYTMTEALTLSEYQAKMKAPSQLDMMPQTCTITSIDWAQSREHANWYCAATAGGLIRIECLD